MILECKYWDPDYGGCGHCSVCNAEKTASLAETSSDKLKRCERMLEAICDHLGIETPK